MSGLERLMEWGTMLQTWCALDDGPDAMSVTVDAVMLHVTADGMRLATPAGVSTLDPLAAVRYELVETAPLSSKQHWNTVRNDEEASNGS